MRRYFATLESVKLVWAALHASHNMRAIATNSVAWSVCLSVCVSVCWSRSWALQKRLNQWRYRLGGWLRWGSRSDESIRSREGWQFGDAAFSRNSLTTCFIFYAVSVTHSSNVGEQASHVISVLTPADVKVRPSTGTDAAISGRSRHVTSQSVFGRRPGNAR